MSFSLRSKRFQSSYCAKVRAGPLSLPCPFFFFRSCPNFLDELARKRLLRRLCVVGPGRLGRGSIVPSSTALFMGTLSGKAECRLPLRKKRQRGPLAIDPNVGGVLTIYTNNPGENRVQKHKTLRFDVVGERPAVSLNQPYRL